MPSLLKTQSDWNVYWTSYDGLVRVILQDTSIAFGYTTGEILSEQYQEPGMGVMLDSGKEVFMHPQYVWPVEYRTDPWSDHLRRFYE